MRLLLGLMNILWDLRLVDHELRRVKNAGSEWHAGTAVTVHLQLRRP